MPHDVWDPNLGNVKTVWDFLHTGAPTNGTAGTFAGLAGIGDRVTDTVTGITYQNQGTLLSPTWVQMGSGGTVAITGGTMDDVAITGGSVDESAIGATTPAAGSFTDLVGRGSTSASSLMRAQGAPAAKTVSATLTAAELLGGIITVAQGAAGASNLQSPTGTAILNALPASFAIGDSFDVAIINTSTVAAEIANLTVNTDVTIVGSAAIAAIAAGVASQGIFRFRMTAAHVFVAYRIG